MSVHTSNCDVDSDTVLDVFIKNKSQEHFNQTKKEASAEKAVLQVDLAETFSCQYQDELQSAHWGNPQVAVFTGVVWYGEMDLRSFANVADNITKDRYCEDLFMRKCLEEIFIWFDVC
jgi:(2Fe-2S) ferredoxin